MKTTWKERWISTGAGRLGAGLMLAATMSLGGLGAAAAQTSGTAGFGPVSEYFPVGTADSWTYDWTVRLPDGSSRKVSRTRAIEGREFISAEISAYKLVASDGDFVILSVDDRALRLHGSAEKERELRFTFDPPVLLLSSDMMPGKSVVLTESDAGGSLAREWTTTFDGFHPVETPMGKFDQAAKVRLAMKSPEIDTHATYYFVKRIGLVAYQYEARRKSSEKSLISVDARLHFAQLGGRLIKKYVDLVAGATTAPAGAKPGSSARARKIFKDALDSRYMWDKGFKGFQAAFLLVTDGKSPISGTIRVDPGLHVSVECPDSTARARVQSELSEFLNHREPRAFDEVYGKAEFRLGEEDPGRGAQIFVEGDAMGTSYRIKDNQVIEVNRAYGRVRYETLNHRHIRTADGRSIAVEYEIVYYSNETNQVVDQIKYLDGYEKIGGYYLPKSRKKTETAGQKISVLELTLSNFQ
ncbi:MAG: DUF3386 family protein [Acidobacteria bacterium]|nr:DUF3386 family protein [Acidobacteriota bacterium]